MQQSEIQIGLRYAIREPTTTGTPMEQVRVLEKVRSGRWKVEWIDPNPGLVDYVKSSNIICRWSDRKAVLRDEKRQAVLNAIADRDSPDYDSPITRAVETVLDATGEREIHVHKGIFTYQSAVLERVADRAGVPTPTSNSGYKDRRGWSHLPFQCGLDLARSFAAAEPSTVLAVVETAERRLEAESREPGNSRYVPLLNEYRAAWALVRQWAGHDAALAERDRRIQELTELLNRIKWDLRSDTPNPKAISARIERVLTGR